MVKSLFKRSEGEKSRIPFPFLLRLVIILSLISIYFIPIDFIQTKNQDTKSVTQKTFTKPTLSPTVTLPSKNRSIEVTPKASPSYRQEAPGDWGVAKQLSKHTWTIKVGDDTRMATPQEILDALNAYRQRNGKGALAWDDKLATYAQSRAEEFAKMGTTDEHQGFNNFLNNQDGFRQLGFYGLGENSAFGFKLIGVHLIEWIFAADEGHNNNQLNSKWSNVGIGVSGLGVDLIFGGDRM